MGKPWVDISLVSREAFWMLVATSGKWQKHPVGTRLEYDRQAVNEKLERKMGMSSINMLMDAFCGRGDLSLLFQKT